MTRTACKRWSGPGIRSRTAGFSGIDAAVWATGCSIGVGAQIQHGEVRARYGDDPCQRDVKHPSNAGRTSERRKKDRCGVGHEQAKLEASEGSPQHRGSDRSKDGHQYSCRAGRPNSGAPIAPAKNARRAAGSSCSPMKGLGRVNAAMTDPLAMATRTAAKRRWAVWV